MRINIKVHARSKRESVVELPDGSYKVDGYRVAGSMLDFEKDLAGLFA